MRAKTITSSFKERRYFIEESLEDTASPSSSGDAVVVELEPDIEYQKLIGFGGAFTEAGAYSLSFLPDDAQEKLVNSLFGENSIRYSLCRTHMQSCDFCMTNYAYVRDKDKALQDFSIEHDKIYLLPFIQRACAQKQDIKLVAAPWSPPAFMKTSSIMNRGGSLLPAYAGLWAECIAKYIDAYGQESVPIWAVSTQNEPEAVQTWESCLYTAEEEADFIEKHLHPALQRHGLDTKIVVWDHNRDGLFERASTIYKKESLRDIVWGAGFHWYEEVSIGRSMHEELQKTHDAFPDKHLILTEAAQELSIDTVELSAWETGERYTRNIIGDLNAWAAGWIDWNMILNSEGGPNHAGNYCDASIRIDTVTKEVEYTSIYYAIGHFSAYLEESSVRIKYKTSKPLQLTSWKKGNTITLVLLHDEDETKTVDVCLEKHVYRVEMKPHSIQTVILERQA